MGSSVSTLDPVFAPAGMKHSADDAFFVGLAASVGANVGMVAVAPSDDGAFTGRGNSWARGLITGGATALGERLHTLFFPLTNLPLALKVGFELLLIVCIRYRFVRIPLIREDTPDQHHLPGCRGRCCIPIGVWLGRIGAGVG